MVWNFGRARRRKSKLALLYWFLNLGYGLVMIGVPVYVYLPFSRYLLYDKTKTIVALTTIFSVIGATYGISLFVFWWLRPGFYNRWDERRKK